MKVVFTAHALRQMKERNIRAADVQNTIHKPDKLIRQSKERYRAIRTLLNRKGEKLLVVIYDTRGTRREIVTAFITTKTYKYL